MSPERVRVTSESRRKPFQLARGAITQTPLYILNGFNIGGRTLERESGSTVRAAVANAPHDAQPNFLIPSERWRADFP